MNGKKASILIIGNEILSGKVADQNAPYLSTELRKLGVLVDRVTIIPDQIETIADEIRAGRDRSDLIFVCGGMGPTLDDVTMEGISLGLERPLILHTVLRKQMEESYGTVLNGAQLKMASVPEGTELIMTESLRIPVLHYEQIYIFPGIPKLVVKKFEAIKERFREAPFYLVKISLKEREDHIAEDLTKTLATFPGLALGSYPILHQSKHRTLLTLESKEKDYLEKALKYLLDRLPRDVMVEPDPNFLSAS